MQASSIPPKVPLPFAAAGARNIIPTASQIGITPGAASLTDGFPPVTRTPLAAGGIPPFGQDMNGILNLISGMAQWFGAGGPVGYDAAFSAAIGGYPAGAQIASQAQIGIFWISLVDNNTSDPDTGGANWLATSYIGRRVLTYGPGVTSWTVPPGVFIVYAKGYGSGGGGGGSSVAGGCAVGGGGGGFFEGFYSVSPGLVIPITVVSGGAAGLTTPTNGGAGATTSFGGFGSAFGGNGGAASAGGVTLGGAQGGGATGGPGTFRTLTGQSGSPGFTNGGSSYYGGQGGASPTGGGIGRPNNVGTTSDSGQTPGGGGNGGGAVANGGAGANGYLEIRF